MKELLKNNGVLRRAVKSLKISKEFCSDAADYKKYYLESAEKRGNHQYKIMLIVHSIEKGMCMKEARPFGQKKIIELCEILDGYCDTVRDEFEYRLGMSALQSWMAYFEQMKWTDDDTYLKIKKRYNRKTEDLSVVGKHNVTMPKKTVLSYEYLQMLSDRKSVREYEKKEIDISDIQYAVQCFLATPTACNRQMCKVYRIKRASAKEILDKTILGVSGFDCSTINYFIITYDIAAFDFFGERNQGYLNAGLAAMNFVNGLHVRGIGSCLLQWANKRSEDKEVRKILGLPESERIAVVVAAGYYKENTVVPNSCRKPIQDIYKEIS